MHPQTAMVTIMKLQRMGIENIPNVLQMHKQMGGGAFISEEERYGSKGYDTSEKPVAGIADGPVEKGTLSYETKEDVNTKERREKSLTERRNEGVNIMERRMKSLTDKLPETGDNEAGRGKSLTEMNEDHTGSEESRAENTDGNTAEV